MKKLVFALALVCTLPILFGTQDAWALDTTCQDDTDNDVLLRDTELYISDASGVMHKMEQSDGSSCVLGLMSYTDLAGNAQTARCTDVALDQTNQILYCVDDNGAKNPEQSQCYTINRNTAAATALGSINLAGVQTNNLNSFEIGPFGGAWVASDTGFIYDIDPTNCNLSNRVTLSTGVTNPVRASGDLVFDVQGNNHLFLTSFDCDNCALACVDGGGNAVQCNGLYKIAIIGKTVQFISDTGFLDVFAGDWVKDTNNLCFATQGKELFMLDPINGVQQGATLGTAVAAFGGTALVFTAGAEILIDQTALLLAAMQSSTNWIIPVMLAGLGLAAFVLARKF